MSRGNQGSEEKEKKRVCRLSLMEGMGSMQLSVGSVLGSTISPRTDAGMLFRAKKLSGIKSPCCRETHRPSLVSPKRPHAS